MKNNEWAFKYDDVSDILYFSPKNKKVSVGSILVPAGESCISARVGVSGNIESIVIEDFGAVFVPENKDLKALYEKLTRRDFVVEPVVVRHAYSLLLSDFRSAVNAFHPVMA